MSLKKMILKNQVVYIRGYGRDAHGTQLYKDLYKMIFRNFHVEKDPTNNTAPHKLIQRLTDNLLVNDYNKMREELNVASKELTPILNKT